ncbi:Fic family protein [[Flexibacter] sp. ATCC 35208]|uniref:Fic family protein n=1 Tax=[Flexibacter] sp. ATCC 35208 TaxID=1936242 RepID=UPI001F3CEB95|nr:Fic family protein [[Flexibacter] sp. ATCC 35208]
MHLSGEFSDITSIDKILFRSSCIFFQMICKVESYFRLSNKCENLVFAPLLFMGIILVSINGVPLLCGDYLDISPQVCGKYSVHSLQNHKYYYEFTNIKYIHRIIAANMYIHELDRWPFFTWNKDKLGPKLGEVRFRQGKILGQMNALGFKLQEETMLQTLTLDVIKSSEIEGKLLNPEQVRSSIARRLGIDIAGAIYSERDVEGVVEMMLDATQNYKSSLTEERLFDWHAALFPTGRSGMYKITVAGWRNNTMQVTSGPMGREKVHFEAPAANKVSSEMSTFLQWLNNEQQVDPVIKAAIAHLWFVTIHPFDDGNGRIARAITDMQLARADQNKQRFHSMSAQIQKERNEYYDVLEKTQRGDLDITLWLEWFLNCLYRSMDHTDQTIGKILERSYFWETHNDITFNVRQQKMLQVILDDFFGKLNVSKWAKMTKISTDTALRDIQDLVKKNILEQEGSGKNTSYRLKNFNKQ